MSTAALPGWEEVFDGVCVRAQVQHLLERADATRARELLEEADNA